MSQAQRAADEAFEREALRKANEGIAAGERRLARQDALVATLDAAGRDTTQARELAVLFRETLDEWRKHRVLTEQRLADLAAKD